MLGKVEVIIKIIIWENLRGLGKKDFVLIP